MNNNGFSDGANIENGFWMQLEPQSTHHQAPQQFWESDTYVRESPEPPAPSPQLQPAALQNPTPDECLWDDALHFIQSGGDTIWDEELHRLQCLPMLQPDELGLEDGEFPRGDLDPLASGDGDNDDQHDENDPLPAQPPAPLPQHLTPLPPTVFHILGEEWYRCPYYACKGKIRGDGQKMWKHIMKCHAKALL